MLYCEKCNYLFNIKKNIPESTEVGHLFCDNCGNTKPLNNNTLIFQTKSNKNTATKVELENVRNDIYLRKIIAGCPNEKCKTNEKKRTEVIMYRDDDFNSFYLCTTCNEKIETI